MVAAGEQAEAEKLPEWQQKLGKQLLLRRVGEAYGRMILGSGIFQADCHPGNILVNGSGLVGVLLSPATAFSHVCQLAAHATWSQQQCPGLSACCLALLSGHIILIRGMKTPCAFTIAACDC